MMANQLGISQPQTSKHLRILHDAGLVTVTIDANRRRYALKSQALEPLDAWRTYMARETERLDRERRMNHWVNQPLSTSIHTLESSIRMHSRMRTGHVNPDLPVMTITNEFLDTSEGTLFISRSEFPNEEALQQVVEMGAVEGFTSQLNRLEAIVSQ